MLYIGFLNPAIAQSMVTCDCSASVKKPGQQGGESLHRDVSL